MKEQHEFAGYAAHADVESFRQTKIAGYADEAGVREIGLKLRTPVGRAVIHNKDVQFLALFGFFERLDRATQHICAVVRDDESRNPDGLGRLRLVPRRISRLWRDQFGFRKFGLPQLWHRERIRITRLSAGVTRRR